jgi:AcrR family transcriptional regulator
VVLIVKQGGTLAVHPGERADAARNRRAILAAAEHLLRHHEPGQVTIEQVAAAAGVSKATVFHRFASRTGLMRALMEERAQALHQAVTSGPPPLGPGAPPGERLAAFLDAVIDLASRNAGLLTAHEHALATRKDTASARETNPVYLFWHSHTSALIAQARPGLDADLLAHILLGSLHTDTVARLIRDGQADRVQACMHILAATLPGTSAQPRA